MHKIEFIVLCNRELNGRELDEIISETKQDIKNNVESSTNNYRGTAVLGILTDNKYYKS